jgi:hypothetical protein
MKPRHLLADTTAVVALGIPISLIAAGATQASASPRVQTSSLHCSARQTVQEVTRAVQHGTSASSKLLSEDKNTLLELQKTKGNTEAITACQRDVAALESVKREVANANNQTTFAWVLMGAAGSFAGFEIGAAIARRRS